MDGCRGPASAGSRGGTLRMNGVGKREREDT